MHRFSTTLFALSTAGLLGLSSAAQATDYQFDKAHTNIQFAVNHNGISSFLGQFQQFEGSFDINEQDLTQSSFSVTIKTASVDTDVKALDDHLKNEDFFNVSQHPEMTFTSKQLVQVGPNRYAVQGDLTMLGKTLPVTLDARLNFQGKHPLAQYYPQYDTDYLGFSATTTVQRSQWGMGTYAPMLADLVDIRIETELKRSK